MTQSSSVTQVSEFIAKLNQESPNTVGQRLKEWYLPASAKKGNSRQELKVKECFPYLFKWIISLLPSDCRQLALAIDATNIKQNFTVLSINFLINGCAIPIAWKIVKATEKGSWKPYWQELLSTLKTVIEPDFLVVVLADRGLYADWLYQEIIANGWHPMLRINHQGCYCLPQTKTWQPLNNFVSKGQQRAEKLSCFKTNPLSCTLLGAWAEKYLDPWLVVTDLNPNQEDSFLV